MSLQVWLPLNGDLRNQGLQDITVTNNGAVVNTSGKIGKCYSTTNGLIKLDKSAAKSLAGDFSIACWIYINSWNVGYQTIWCIGASDTNAAWPQGIAVLLRNGTTNKLCFSISDLSSATTTSCQSDDLEAGKWYHVACCYTTGRISMHINGSLVKDFTTSIMPKTSSAANFQIGRYATSYLSDMKINDFRVYDHCLSPKEVKELSKGLVLHYKLSNEVQTMDSAYSSIKDACAQWGAYGSNGSMSWDTSSAYIFNSMNTGSRKVTNASTATGNYLIYQQLTFSGGYRSFQAIIKASDSAKITNDICFPTWNGMDGGTSNNKWTDIIDLGNGFYLCKCEGIKQKTSPSTSNDHLVGIYVRPGKTIYVTEWWLENNREVCSYPFATDDAVHDCSGYGYDGTKSGTIIAKADTTRYNNSCEFASGSSITHPNPLGASDTEQEWTVCAWVKPYTSNGGQKLNSFNLGNYILFTTEQLPLLYLNSDTNDYYIYGQPSITINEWNHIAFVFKNSTALRKIYVNGVDISAYGPNATSTPLGINTTVTVGQNFIGEMSDYRVYATALSAEDIKELYNTALSIDNAGTVYAYEYNEISGTGIGENGVLGMSMVEEYGNARIIGEDITVGNNLVYDMSSGGNTTKIDTYTITTGTNDSDTYFYANLSPSIKAGDVVTVSCDVSGFKDDSHTWNFPFYKQGSGLPFNLKNGHCVGTFTVPSESTGTSKLIFDDNGYGGGFTRGDCPITITNFKIEMGNKATPWVPHTNMTSLDVTNMDKTITRPIKSQNFYEK